MTTENLRECVREYKFDGGSPKISRDAMKELRDMSAELAALRSDRDRLAAELARMQKHYAKIVKDDAFTSVRAFDVYKQLDIILNPEPKP
jgi:hypothetical protein